MNSVTVVGIDIIPHDNSFYELVYETNSFNTQIHLILSVSMNSFQSMKSMKSFNIWIQLQSLVLISYIMTIVSMN
jgi:hypothetical protein